MMAFLAGIMFEAVSVIYIYACARDGLVSAAQRPMRENTKRCQHSRRCELFDLGCTLIDSTSRGRTRICTWLIYQNN
jgi:hypothetical protein